MFLIALCRSKHTYIQILCNSIIFLKGIHKMNNAINKRCATGTAYSPRVNSDVLFQMPAGSFNYGGYFDETAKLIQDQISLYMMEQG